jgi:GAF domain-containing protein
MNAMRLFALLVYTFGVLAYGAMLALWIGEMGRRGWGGRTRAVTPGREVDALNGVLLAVSFLWFLCNVGSLIVSMTPRTSAWPLEAATVVLAFCFPPVIMHVSWAEVSHNGEQPLSPGWRIALWPAYAVCLSMPIWALMLLAAPISSRDAAIANRILGGGLSGAFIATAIYCMALLTRRRPTAGLRDRQSRRSILVLFACMIAVFILLFVVSTFTASVRPMAALGDFIEVIAKSLPLVFVFVGTYYENRFQFFDLFVKRGVGFVLSIVVLTIWLAAMLPVLRPVISTWAAPWIFAIALIPAVVVIPWLYAIVSRALDRRWLGRRFTPQEALSHFMGALRSATTEPQLIARAQEGLQQIFGADAIVSLVSNPDAAVPTVSAAPPTTAGTSTAVQTTAVRSGDRVVGNFLLGTRVGETPYFSQDVQLLGSLAGVFAHVLENLRLQARKLEQEQRARELSLHASRSELKALRAQINPHFLFNALNSIAGLIHRDPAVADRTIEQLADVFRYALRGAESEWAMLDDELDFVRSYLEVERARFGDRLHTGVRADPSVRGAWIPTMIVQTLVENAVKHGASTVRNGASVVVDAHAEGERLVVSVVDNGPGFDGTGASTPRAGGGYGLVNVQQRLEGYFGSDGGLTVTRSDGLTMVAVSLPLVRQEPKPHTAREARR